ncbi:MAG: glucosaminidase domain-containing protein [Telmatospirillum sp.]|nr:glucosaminidase domain-containing protein [Telmatospirillum sp.]
MAYDTALRAAPSGSFRAGGTVLVAAILVPIALALALVPPSARAPGLTHAFVEQLPDTQAALVPDMPRFARMAAGDLYALFVERGYELGALRRGGEPVPRLVVEQLPGDLAELDSIDLRKSVFIKSLLPLLLLENERISTEREKLLAVVEKAGPPDAKDAAFLEELAERYDTAPGNLRELLRRVDVVPVSLALAQAALESGWGTSRGAKDGHSVFGHMRFGVDDEGRVRHFADLPTAVEAYALNLNTHRAYAEFRRARAALRAEGKPLDGHSLAQHLHRYSERRMDYVRDVRSVMRANALRSLDQAKLDLDG